MADNNLIALTNFFLHTIHYLLAKLHLSIFVHNTKNISYCICLESLNMLVLYNISHDL